MGTTTIDAAGSDPIEVLQANGGGTEVMRVTSAGKVGIGTASPIELLDIRSGTYGNIRSNLTDTVSKIILGNVSGHTQEGYISYDVYDNHLELGTLATERIRITNDGHVGVGTTSLGALLQAKCDGSSTDQLRLENSGTNGKVWTISGGLDSAPGDLTVRDQTDSKTVAAFHYASVSSNDIRSFRVGLRDESQSGQEVIGVGQLQTLLGSARNGNSLTMRMDNSSPPFAELAATFRNQADTDSFTGGYLVINKISGQNKASLELATYNGSGFSTNAIYIDPDGKIGFGTNTIDSGDSIKHANGAHLTTGGIWTSTSSRDSKKDIKNLEHEEAKNTLMALNPVKYSCKSDEREKHVGFIAEDVPELVASRDRKGLSPMDIVGVLTKVVQEQQKKIDELAVVLKNLTAPGTSN